jgi:N-acetylglutamate synthase-like GNAT family acetyltransferase
MTRFIYTAEKNGGDVYKATAEAKDRFELFAQIRREGAKVLSVVEDRSDSPWSLSYWNSRFATIPELEKVQFAQTLASMLKAGLALSRALSVISRQTKNPRFSHIVNTIEADVRQGGATRIFCLAANHRKSARKCEPCLKHRGERLCKLNFFKFRNRSKSTVPVRQAPWRVTSVFYYRQHLRPLTPNLGKQFKTIFCLGSCLVHIASVFFCCVNKSRHVIR